MYQPPVQKRKRRLTNANFPALKHDNPSNGRHSVYLLVFKEDILRK